MYGCVLGAWVAHQRISVSKDGVTVVRRPIDLFHIQRSTITNSDRKCQTAGYQTGGTIADHLPPNQTAVTRDGDVILAAATDRDVNPPSSRRFRDVAKPSMGRPHATRAARFRGCRPRRKPTVWPARGMFDAANRSIRDVAVLCVRTTTSPTVAQWEPIREQMFFFASGYGSISAIVGSWLLRNRRSGSGSERVLYERSGTAGARGFQLTARRTITPLAASLTTSLLKTSLPSA